MGIITEDVLSNIINKVENVVDNDIVDMVQKKLKEEYEKMGKVNIVIAGKTGVGKSTLINAMFGKKMAKTSVGTRGTEEIRKYESPNSPLTIYDNVGFEMRNTDEVIKETKDLIDKKRKSGDIKDYIHCIWYCVRGDGDRIEEEEIKIIKEFVSMEDVPVIVVLTQSSRKKRARNLEAFINDLNLPIKNCIKVLAQNDSFENADGEELIIPAYGCDELADFTVSILPEAAQKAFINAQVANLKLKQEKAHWTVISTATAAFAEGFIPLPFADAAALVPTQVAMISGITAIYGVNLKKATISAILSSTLGTATATMLGKTLVANIIKFIPGLGTGAGGAISGAIASVITVSLGEIVIGIMNKLIKGEITEEELKNKDTLKKIQEDYRNELKRQKNFMDNKGTK